jgi:hypothetical protein
VRDAQKKSGGGGSIYPGGSVMTEPLVDQVAQAIYETHWREPSPAWSDTSDEVRDWVRKQAWSAINAVREADRVSRAWPRLVARHTAGRAR